MTFIQQLKKRSKKTYFLIVLFIIGTLITTLSKKEIVPFFLYKMYSYPIPTNNTYHFYQLNYNQNSFLNISNIWDHHRRLMFNYSIRNYDFCLNNNGYDETQIKLINSLKDLKIIKNFNAYPFKKQDIDGYPKWLLEYTQQLIPEIIDSISVIKFTASYDNNAIKIIDQKQILSYKK